jgi:hypothetical protein
MFLGELREELSQLARHELAGTHLFVAVGRFDLPRRRLPTHLAPCHPTCNGASRGMDDAGLERLRLCRFNVSVLVLHSSRGLMSQKIILFPHP